MRWRTMERKELSAESVGLEGWTEQLRLACETLSRSSENLPMVIEVAGRLGEAPGELMSLLTLSDRLSDEYGVEHRDSLDGHTVTLRLRRRA